MSSAAPSRVVSQLTNDRFAQLEPRAQRPLTTGWLGYAWDHHSVPEPRTAPKGDPRPRQGVLDAAAAIMVEDGYAAATTRSVASRAGVNNARGYYYVGTMDDLF